MLALLLAFALIHSGGAALRSLEALIDYTQRLADCLPPVGRPLLTPPRAGMAGRWQRGPRLSGGPSRTVDGHDVGARIDTRDYSRHIVLYGQEWWQGLTRWARRRRNLMERMADKLVMADRFC